MYFIKANNINICNYFNHNIFSFNNVYIYTYKMYSNKSVDKYFNDILIFKKFI